MQPIVIQKTTSTATHIQIDEHEGVKSIDIRDHVTTKKYTGYTAKGVKIPLDKARELLDAVAATVKLIEPIDSGTKT